MMSKRERENEDLSLSSLKSMSSNIKVMHFIDVKLVGFQRNGNGEIRLQEQQLADYLTYLGTHLPLCLSPRVA